jgi:hypothetical protein
MSRVAMCVRLAAMSETPIVKVRLDVGPPRFGSPFPEETIHGSLSTRRPTRPSMLEGDIVVTRVARHYALGRVTPNRRTQMPVENHNDSKTAVSRACVLAGVDHHVFLWSDAGSHSASILVDCYAIVRPCSEPAHGSPSIVSAMAALDNIEQRHGETRRLFKSIAVVPTRRATADRRDRSASNPDTTHPTPRSS